MDYGRLKTELKEISEIASKVPEPFREKTFTVLLERLVADLNPASGKPSREKESPDPPAEPKTGGSPGPTNQLKLPAPIRVWMTRTGVTPSELAAVVTVEDDEVHFIREPSAKGIAQGQIEWALLLALKEGLTGNNLTVDPEAVRSIIQEKGFYSSANFTKYFRTPKNARLFRGTLVAQGEARSLTTEGQNALGALVKALASSSA